MVAINILVGEIMMRYDYDLSRSAIKIEQVRTMPGYDEAKSISEITKDISPQEFETNYRIPLRPAVLRGGVTHWPATQLWSNLDYLVKKSGQEKIHISKGLALDFLLKHKVSKKLLLKNRHKFIQTMTVKEYLKYLSTQYDPNTILYARSAEIPTSLLDDVGVLPCCSEAEFNNLLFFGRSSFTDLHEHSGSDAFMCQISGTKEVILFPPDDINAKALYRRPGSNWSPVRLFNVDLKKFPLFSKATPYRVTVNAGDALYIPNPWWHAVVSLDDVTTTTVACFFPPKRYDFKSPQTRSLFLRRPWASRRHCKQEQIVFPSWFELLKKSFL